VWGYSIPRLYGLGSTRPPVSAERKILPLEAHGVKVMSIGFFLEEDAAVVWRGPMLHKALTQFLQDVDWGALDFLLIDLPPGTGDVSMTLAQLLPQAKFVIVTTPQATAQKVARRSAEMAHKVSLEIGGVIENMSGFTTPGGERFAIFGEGGGRELADELDVPLLGKIPLTMPLREHADSGTPLVIEDSGDPASQAILQAARGLIAIGRPPALPVLPLVRPSGENRRACHCRWPERPAPQRPSSYRELTRCTRGSTDRRHVAPGAATAWRRRPAGSLDKHTPPERIVTECRCQANKRSSRTRSETAPSRSTNAGRRWSGCGRKVSTPTRR
jgi:MinD-like ATPase involved in chromosome partitioning or flagellar assembly